MKITKSRLKEIIREELVEFKSFPKSSKALKGKDIVWRIKNSHEKGYKDFFRKKTLDAIAKKGKLTAKQLDQMLPDSVPGNLIYNLWNEDEVNEVNEGLSDLEFVIDQLSNSMEHYDEKEFVSHLSKETKYNASSLKKVFNAYWKLGAMERNDMFMGGDAKPWLKKLGIR